MIWNFKIKTMIYDGTVVIVQSIFYDLLLSDQSVLLRPLLILFQTKYNCISELYLQEIFNI